jgi:7 transmembrane receptor (rhodopsin family)
MFSSDPVEAFWEIFFSILELWSFFFSVIGNSIVIFVMAREKKLRRKSNFYILSVAFVDLLMGLVVIPFSLYSVK